jgi:FtsP/CotA-like multicopper oxidase with cupredoxin domain
LMYVATRAAGPRRIDKEIGVTIRLGAAFLIFINLPAMTFAQSIAPISANDNRRPAGMLASNVLTLNVVAERGQWRPEGANGGTLSVYAFREEGGSLLIPGPLIRVPTGTEIHVSIRNALSDTSLEVFGLQDRPATRAQAVVVPPGEKRDVVFRAGAPGTYHYWAATGGHAFGARTDVDSQLSGALVVDPPGVRPDDRIMVIGLWVKPGTNGDAGNNIGAINGTSWPATDVLNYRTGESVRWRIINLSSDNHAMHLHGMFFDVVSTSNGLTSQLLNRPLTEVTHAVPPGSTFDMNWQPERAGNWLFHCHMTVHMMGDAVAHNMADHIDEPSGGMAGIVVGIRVTGTSIAKTSASSAAPRRFTLRLREDPNRYGTKPGYRVDAEGIQTSTVSDARVPGPIIVLQRGEPVEVNLVNELHAPTAIHWHGIELESYYDGVPGWGGTPGSTTPSIKPGQTFTAKFTPSRAGTFIYHEHSADDDQLAGGLYGPLIVLEPGQRFDPTTDHIFIAGHDGPEFEGQPREPVVVNGKAAVPAGTPVNFPLRAGVPNRLRLINITPGLPALTFVLTDGFNTVAWTPVGKDGAELPAAARVIREARQLVAVGETYDFEITPKADERLWLNLVRGNGEWVVQTRLVVRP